MTTQKNNCLFCQIVTKRLPAYIIFETTTIIAFLDAFPADYGHTLIIPKRCVPNILELTPEEGMEMHIAIQHVMKLLWTKLQPKGFNLVNNFNRVAGQVVNHHHVHIIPKYQAEKGWYGTIHEPPLKIAVPKVWEKLKN